MMISASWETGPGPQETNFLPSLREGWRCLGLEGFVLKSVVQVPSVLAEGLCCKPGGSAVHSMSFVLVWVWGGQVVSFVGGAWFGVRGMYSVC